MSNSEPANVMAAQNTGISGDLNAGFAFFLDVIVNIFVLSGILIGAFGFPGDVVFGRIVPGSIMGILVGNIAFVLYARRLAKQSGQKALTSIPSGLDLPTVFGMCFFVLGPLFAMNKENMGVEAAADLAWGAGMAAAFFMAGVKLLLSFISRTVERGIPPVALIGAMAGIATVWLGAEALIGVFVLPEIGLIAFAVMAFALIAGHQLPFRFPGAIAAILLGTIAYYMLAFVGASGGYEVPAAPELTPALPSPTLLGLESLGGPVVNYFGLLFPFALLIASSSINVVAGARVVGDNYDPATIIRLDSMATAICALFGGTFQTTPYFGHPTYKRMGAGVNYSLGAALLITVGGFAGVIAYASVMVPEPVLKPILVVVAADILRLAFAAGDTRHAPAVMLAIVPAIMNYAYTKVSDLFGRIGAEAQAALASDFMTNYLLLGVMARGYILTSLIWGAMMVWIIDRKFIQASGAALTAALMTSFGIIHSVLTSSGMYLPWDLPDVGGVEALSSRISLAYLIMGIMLLIATRLPDNKEAPQIEQ